MLPHGVNMSREGDLTSSSDARESSTLLLQSEVSAEPSQMRSSFISTSENGASARVLLLKAPIDRIARKSLGIILLLTTVFLWTVSNFLSSTIFADDSYSKPFFVTYINTSVFAIPLPFILLKRLRHQGKWPYASPEAIKITENYYGPISQPEADPQLTSCATDEVDDSFQALSASHDSQPQVGSVIVANAYTSEEPLDIKRTARLGLEFCLLWFGANYFVSACLTYTTVASSTILTSTSSIWTLLIGTVLGVETFTTKKLLGVITSLAGIALISKVDISGENDRNRGSFPHKSPQNIALGDVLALASAVLYGFYAIFMKKRVGGEANLSMPLFFGFVGMINLVTLWPGLFVLHFTGAEVFEWPHTRRIWVIVLVNSTISLVSDFCWAYATLLTSPILVTVGLSLSIPLSLIGQILLNSQTSTGMYWVGAAIVCIAFVIVNYEIEDSDPHVENFRLDSGSEQ